MVFELILSILVDIITDPVKQYVVTPIKQNLSYAFKCDSKVQTLQDKVVRLKNKKDRLQQSIDAARRNGEEIYENVTKWLSAVENDIEEAEKLILEKEEAKKKCFAGFCPNLKTRYQLSKKVEKKALAIDKLQSEEELDVVSFHTPLQQIVEPSVYSREALSSRVSMLNQLMGALKDPKLKMIGVYGMGGVGKTTLAKEVQRKAIEEKLFETVVLVAVSQTPEIRRIQAEIADFLGLKFDVEEVPGRASELYERLKKSKVLIILDDVWQKLELNVIGIPCGDSCEGCKVFLTSRRKDVLSGEMRTQKEFPLNVLGEEEALHLFQTEVDKVKDPKLHPIAVEIAKKCAGLPLLILIVAKELQNKDLYAWEAMLKQLSVSGDIHQKVQEVLESSFENLPGEEVKSLFLLCAMFSHSNIPIQYLLIYSMGLDLFKHIVIIKDARNRLLSLIDKLKSECLLLEGDMAGYVKMHDVVRDATISISSRLQHAFIGTGQVRLRDWPNQDCTRIALPYCDVHELPADLKCPKAELFSIFTEDPYLEIPDTFFEGIRKLKVVDFTGMHLMSLPSSLGLVANLHTLCLRGCQVDNVAVIGELKQLELLTFSGSKIVELPRELEVLTQLKLLDLSNCSRLKVIPANVISKLCLLEELYMLNSFDGWDSKGNVSLVELENLARLSTLEIHILNLKLIPKGCTFFDGLQNYKISIGEIWDWSGKYETSRTLKLTLSRGTDLEDGIEALWKSTEDLYLEDFRGKRSWWYENSSPQLKHLHIHHGDDSIRHLIKSKMSAPCHAFPILESLNLKFLCRLEKICDGPLGMGSFGELQILKISYCDKLQNLFSFSSVKYLPKLQEMEVESCARMEAIVCEDDNYNNEVSEFTQLRSLELRNLPNFRGFCKRQEETQQMKLIFNELVSFPNLTSLVVDNCYRLKYVFATSMVKCLEQLKTLRIITCNSVEEIIQSNNYVDTEDQNMNKIVFPKLNHLHLSHLKKMKRFSCGHPIEFPSLTELEMESCSKMENFVSKFSGNQNHEKYLFNEMVTFSNLEILKISFYEFRYLWHEQLAVDSFCKLKSLYIRGCSKLLVVFPSNVLRSFHKLENLDVQHCAELSEIFQGQRLFDDVHAFSLRDLYMHYLPSLKHIWSTDTCKSFTFKNLQSLHVSECGRGLKYVFPESIATGLLPQLQKLEICRCPVEVIIAKANDEESKSSPPSFKFSQLTSLKLVDLNGMTSLYEGPHTSEWPKLKCLEAYGFDKIMKFGSDQQMLANLEELTIDGKGLKTINRTGEISEEFYSKLKKITLTSLNQESNAFLLDFLRQFYSLDTVVFYHVYLNEIVLLDGEKTIGDEEHKLRLKHLKFSCVHYLKHIRSRDLEPDFILQYLQTLEVKYCGGMMSLTSSPVSFENLKTLNVESCKSMKNLVTASTAKTMVHLIELRVSDCPMKEIVASDGDCTEHDVINFNKLKSLKLEGLDNIKSFCSGNYTFIFPLLEQVTIERCPFIESFSCGVLSTPKLRGVLLDKKQQLWEGDLNATIAFKNKNIRMFPKF